MKYFGTHQSPTRRGRFQSRTHETNVKKRSIVAYRGRSQGYGVGRYCSVETLVLLVYLPGAITKGDDGCSDG